MGNQTSGPELTIRSIAVGLVVALIIGSAYPYCVLKLGFGPNLSVGREDSFAGRHWYRHANPRCCFDDVHSGKHRAVCLGKISPQTEKDYRIPLASGLIAGEAIIAVVLAILAALGVNF